MRLGIGFRLRAAGALPALFGGVDLGAASGTSTGSDTQLIKMLGQFESILDGGSAASVFSTSTLDFGAAT